MNPLKHKAVTAVLRCDEDLFLTTRNPRHVWHAYQIARQHMVPIPDWVLRYLDRIAEHGVTVRTRNTDTADRYDAALTQMQVAVDAHKRRLRIRDVGRRLGKQLGKPIEVEISRRDQPNLSAIARAAAATHRVSVNRLLARYRRSR